MTSDMKQQKQLLSVCLNRRRMAMPLLVCVLALLAASACTDDTDDTDDGATLPPRTCPMTFTASVDGLATTRATTDTDGKTTWEENDPVAISMDGGANHKEYKISNASTGAMVPNGEANTLYWQKSDETKTLAAWYPVSCTIGSSTGGSEVNITDQNTGFGTLENILHAPAQNYTYSSGGSVAFVFRHALAKVKVTLQKGDGIEDSDLSNATVTFTGYTAGSLGYNGMTGSGSNGDITPKTETPVNGGAATYTALVIPQQMQGKKFIKVTVGAGNAARDYYYTPTGSTDADLEAGKQYTYTITVKKTGLDVTVTGNGTAWTDTPIDTNPDATVTFHITAPTSGVTIAAASSSGGTLTDNGNGSYTLSGGNAVSITATSIYIKSIKGLYEVAGDGTTYTLKSDLFIAGYTLADARVGDFYCKSSDGTTGYLIPGDIASLTDAQQQSCIGIVYSTDASRIGKEATEALKKKGVSTPHGLVMALTDASSGCQWGHNGEDENSGGNEGAPFKRNIDYLYKQYADVDGYAETHWIINTYGGNAATLLNTYAAFYHANRYGTTDGGTHQYAVPANVTTGWFIPSMGQWWDILSNLGGVNLDKYKNDTFTSGVVGIPGTTTTTENINKYLRKIKDAKHFSTPDVNFWSSSEYNGIYACSVYSSDGLLCLNAQTKNYGQPYVRCSFAF